MIITRVIAHFQKKNQTVAREAQSDKRRRLDKRKEEAIESEILLIDVQPPLPSS